MEVAEENQTREECKKPVSSREGNGDKGSVEGGDVENSKEGGS